MNKFSENVKLYSLIRDMINYWGIMKLLSTLIEVISDRACSQDDYMIKLRDNLKITLTDYENRYIVNGKDTRFDEG